MRSRMIVVLGAALLFPTLSVLRGVGHHSFFAEFDPEKPVTLRGEVTEIEWANPHAYLYLDVVDEGTGEVINYAVELGSPNSLTRLGWRRTTVGNR